MALECPDALNATRHGRRYRPEGERARLWQLWSTGRASDRDACRKMPGSSPSLSLGAGQVSDEGDQPDRHVPGLPPESGGRRLRMDATERRALGLPLSWFAAESRSICAGLDIPSGGSDGVSRFDNGPCATLRRFPAPLDPVAIDRPPSDESARSEVERGGDRPGERNDAWARCGHPPDGAAR